MVCRNMIMVVQKVIRGWRVVIMLYPTMIIVAPNVIMVGYAVFMFYRTMIMVAQNAIMVRRALIMNSRHATTFSGPVITFCRDTAWVPRIKHTGRGNATSLSTVAR